MTHMQGLIACPDARTYVNEKNRAGHRTSSLCCRLSFCSLHFCAVQNMSINASHSHGNERERVPPTHPRVLTLRSRCNTRTYSHVYDEIEQERVIYNISYSAANCMCSTYYLYEQQTHKLTWLNCALTNSKINLACCMFVCLFINLFAWCFLLSCVG